MLQNEYTMGRVLGFAYHKLFISYALMAPVEGYIFLDKNSQFLFLEENSKTEQCKRLSFDTKVYLFHFYKFSQSNWQFPTFSPIDCAPIFLFSHMVPVHMVYVSTRFKEFGSETSGPVY